MTPYSCDKEKYNTGYIGWLIAYSKYWFSMPFRESEDIVEWLQVTGALIVYLCCTMTAPITFPILTLFVMIRKKRKLVKDHGKENLK